VGGRCGNCARARTDLVFPFFAGGGWSPATSRPRRASTVGPWTISGGPSGEMAQHGHESSPDIPDDRAGSERRRRVWRRFHPSFNVATRHSQVPSIVFKRQSFTCARYGGCKRRARVQNTYVRIRVVLSERFSDSPQSRVQRTRNRSRNAHTTPSHHIFDVHRRDPSETPE